MSIFETAKQFFKSKEAEASVPLEFGKQIIKKVPKIGKFPIKRISPKIEGAIKIIPKVISPAREAAKVRITKILQQGITRKPTVIRKLPVVRDIKAIMPVSKAEQRIFLKGLSSDIQKKISKGFHLNTKETRTIGKELERFLKEGGAPKFITKTEDALLKKRILDEARGSRWGFKAGQKITRDELITKFKDSQETVQALQADILNYIKATLPVETQGKFITSLKGTLTKKKQASIFSRIERTREDLERAKTIGEIKKMGTAKAKKAMARRVDVEYQKRMSGVFAGLNLAKPTEATIRKLRSLKDYISKEGELRIPKRHLEALSRLTRKNVKDLSTKELAELKSELSLLRKIGETKLGLKYKYNERLRQFDLQKLVASTKNLDPKPTGRRGLDIAAMQTKKIYHETLHTPRVADALDGYKAYGGENARMVKNMAKKETLGKETGQNIVDSALLEIRELGIKEIDQGKIMINIRARENATEQVNSLLAHYGYDKIPKLTKQEEEVINIIKKHTNKNGDDIAALYEEIENKPFQKITEYILPLKYEKEFNLIPSETITHGRHRTAQAFKGFTKARKPGVKKMPRTDTLALFEEAIHDQQWYLKMQPELNNISHLVKTPEYAGAAGEIGTDFWLQYLDVVSRRGWSASARSNPLLRWARLNLNTAILGYKVSSIMMQPFAIFDALAYSSSKFGPLTGLRLFSEFSKAWIKPRYAKEMLKKSPALRQRQAGEIAIEESIQKMKTMQGFKKKFYSKALSGLKFADLRTAAGIQGAFHKILTKQGVSNAGAESEFLMNLTQGSAEISLRPLILSHGEAARTWFTFQTFFLNRWGIMAHDLITSGLIKNPSWKKKFTALIGLGIFAAGSIAEDQARKGVYEFITKKKLPDRTLARTLMMSIPKNIPYFGNMIEMMDRGAEADPPIIRVLENLFSGVGSTLFAKTEETKKRGFMKAVESGVTILGVPGTSQFFDFIERIFSDPTGGNKIDIRKRRTSDFEIEKLLGIKTAQAAPVKPVAKAVIKEAPKIIEAFKGFKDLTIKTVEKLKGSTVVSKEHIFNLSNASDLKQAERDLVRNVLKEMPEGKINVKEFADKIKMELLPLKTRTASEAHGAAYLKYESISLDPKLRGNIASYGERIYRSPIKTSAGDVHWSGMGIDDYFAHTRIEDVAGLAKEPGTQLQYKKFYSGKTRRIIELQSDLFQKGGLESEKRIIGKPWKKITTLREKEITKLDPYRNTWHERIIKEEIKQTAKDGKTKLQFPTGKTAMKVEGLGEMREGENIWLSARNQGQYERYLNITSNNLKVGLEINRGGNSDSWIITDVLGDGRFKAITKKMVNLLEAKFKKPFKEIRDIEGGEFYRGATETFDISGKVDTSNPIFKFYEKEVQKYLKRIKPEMKQITDPQGVSWFEIPITKKDLKAPIEAFGIGGMLMGTGEEVKEKIKDFGSEMLLALPNKARELLGIIKRPDYKPIKEAFIKRYNFTPEASKLWDEADFVVKEKADMPPGLHYQEISRLEDILPEKIVKKIPDEIWRIMPFRYKSLIEIYKGRPQVVLHELGHQFWQEGILKGKGRSSEKFQEFNNLWEKLKPNIFELQNTDEGISRFYMGKKVDPEVLTSERFATLFEDACMAGINEIPKPFHKYLKPFIK